MLNYVVGNSLLTHSHHIDWLCGYLAGKYMSEIFGAKIQDHFTILDSINCEGPFCTLRFTSIYKYLTNSTYISVRVMQLFTGVYVYWCNCFTVTDADTTAITVVIITMQCFSLKGMIRGIALAMAEMVISSSCIFKISTTLSEWDKVMIAPISIVQSSEFLMIRILIVEGRYFFGISINWGMILKNLVFQSTVIKFRIVAGGLLFVIALRSVTLCEILHFGILTRAIMWVLHESACSDITSFNADSKDAEI